jgi:Uma2 family endonuclease
MATSLVIENRLRMPLVQTLEDFREWALSDAFPESGRFDFIDGNIEVDLSLERVFTHNAPKVAIVARLVDLSDQAIPGDVFCTRMRFSSVPANLSVQPDVFFLSCATLDSGHAKLIPDESNPEQGYNEVEGGPDVVVEILSDISVKRDKNRLPKAYFEAGVRELWLADARAEELVFLVHCRGQDRFVVQSCDREGWQHSGVFDRRIRLDRWRDKRGYWRYDLRASD